MKKRNRGLRRAAAFVLAAVLAGSSVEIPTAAADGDAGTGNTGMGTAVITAFSDLGDGIRTQTLEVGAEESEIALPESLEVTVTLTDAETSGEQDQSDTGSTEEETQTEPKTEAESEPNADPAADGEEQAGETATETQEPSTSDTEAQTQEPSAPGTEGQPQEPSASGAEGQPQEQPATPGTESQTQEPAASGTEGQTQETSAPAIEAPTQDPSAPGTEAQAQETSAPATEVQTQAESQTAAAAAVQSQEPKQAEPPTEAPVQREAPAAETGAGTKEEKTGAEEGGVLTSFLDTVFPAMTASAAEASAGNPEPVTTTKTVTLTGITWEIDESQNSAAEFSSEETAAGNTYTYIPMLPSTVTIEDAEYTLELEDGVQLPEITVTIEENEIENAVASVKIGGKTTYYENLSDAFAAASSAGSAATVKLLADVSGTIGESDNFIVSGGTITFDLNGHTWTEGTMNSLLFLKNCEMTLQDSSAEGTGEIKNTGRYSSTGTGIWVDSGASLIIESGSVTSSPGTNARGIRVVEGKLTVRGGTISSGAFGVFLYSGSGSIEAGSIAGDTVSLYIGNVDKNAVTLTGGTYTNGILSSTLTAGDLLGDGYGYYNGTAESWINDATAKELTGSVSVQALPVQITGEPSDLNLSYGFESGTAKLQVTAKKGATATGEISYQWYQVSTEEGGTDEKLADSEGGYSGTTTDTLVMPDSWVSGGSGSFYCVVSCGDYSVTSQTANVEIEVCPHSKIVGGVCQGCGKTFEASVLDGTDGSEAYYETFEDAWAAAQGHTAVITLLADAEVSEVLTVTEGSDITLQSDPDPDQEEHILSGEVDAKDSGLIDVTGGSFTFSGGTVSNGSNGTNAIAVNGGSFVLNGGNAEAHSSGNSGICVYGGTADFQSGSASGYIGVAKVQAEKFTLSGGTYSGTSSAVYVDGRLNETVKALLEEGKAYFATGTAGDDTETLITDLEGLTLTGTVTVGNCTHSYGNWINGGETHTGTCVVCGASVTEAHSWKWTDNENGTHTGVCAVCQAFVTEAHSVENGKDNGDGTHTGTCTVCGAKITENHIWEKDGSCAVCDAKADLAASVTTGGTTEYFTDLKEAWTSAKAAGEATVTLLADATVSETLTVEDGDSITLESGADDGSGYGISGSFYGNGIIQVMGGSFTMNGGRLCNEWSGTSYGVSYDLYVTGGSVLLNGGELADVSGCANGLEVTGGKVQIKDVIIDTQWTAVNVKGGGDVRIDGGSIAGGPYGISVQAWNEDQRAKLCITGGSIDSSRSTGMSIAGYSDVEVSGGTITGSNWGMWVYDNYTSTELNISGGRISGGNYGIYVEKGLRSGSITGGIFTGGKYSIYVDYNSANEAISLYSLVRGSKGESGYYYYRVDDNQQETQISESDTYPYSYKEGGWTGTVTVKKPGEEIVSVEISWGSLAYTYTDGTWNTDTYTYEGGGWTADRGGNRITVENTGNVGVTASYSYSQAAGASSVSGSFADAEGNPIGSPVALPIWTESSAYLTLAGKPEDGFDGTLGTVTVTIGGVNDAE